MSMEIEVAENLTQNEITEMVPEPMEDDSETVTGFEPRLYRAAANGKLKKFETMAVEDVLLLLTPNKNNILHIHLTASTSAGDDTRSVWFVAEVIRKYPALVRKVNAKGETPLHIAARYGHFAAVKLLLFSLEDDVENGVKYRLVRATNDDGDTALHEAVRFDHVSIVEYLINEDPDHSYPANKAGETPIFMAAERGLGHEVFELLSKSCDVPDLVGPLRRTVLHCAALHGDTEFARRVLDFWRPFEKQADEKGWIPLHYAADICHTDLLNLLLKKNRSTAYIRDKEGKTALHIAAYRGHTIAMNVIIEYCPDCSEIVDNRGRNALHSAMEGGSEDAARLIVNDSSFGTLLNQKDVRGNTPLHLLAMSTRRQWNLVMPKRLDRMAFNQKNETAFDIASSCLDGASLGQRSKEIKKLEWFRNANAKPGGRMSNFRGKNDEKNEDSENFLRAKDSHLVVAALITTVTFAAGFTLPGGTIQEGENQGSAIFTKRPSFTTFMVADTIAMVLSGSAVFIHLFLVTVDGKPSVYKYLTAAFFFTVFAMGSMIIAFVAGTLTVLGGSSGAGFATFLIGLSFFITFYVLLRKAYYC